MSTRAQVFPTRYGLSLERDSPGRALARMPRKKGAFPVGTPYPCRPRAECEGWYELRSLALTMRWETQFTQIYREHRSFVTKALCSRGVRPHEVEDAIQEVFLTLFRRSPAFDSEAAIRGWLREVASNVALNRARTQRRREPHRGTDAFAIELDLLTDERAQTPERRAATQEQYIRVCGLIERLDSKRRNVVLLCYFEQLSAKDIAERLGTRPSIVNSRLRLARAELKAAIRASCD